LNLLFDNLWVIKQKNRHARARREIDAMFRECSLEPLEYPPAEGWIRELRDALGMTTRELASRMGQSQAAVSHLEQSEVTGKAQLDSLRKAAAALDCDLVYALVPRTSLEETVLARARALARRDLGDGGADDGEMFEERIDHVAARLIESGRLWDDRDPD
jgi:predicted DNA-binding mobile mystery protein A